MRQTPNQFNIYQINYNNFCICLIAKEKSFFFLLSHTLIISLKSSNTLLSPFYFLLHAQLSLGCLLFSKRLTLVCSLSLFSCVASSFFALAHTLFVSSQRRQSFTLSFFLRSFQAKIPFILSWFDALFFFSPKGGPLGQSQRQSQQLLCSIVYL